MKSNSILNNMNANFLGLFGARLFGFILVVSLARIDGALALGTYVLAYSFTALFNLVTSDQSMTALATKEVSHDGAIAGHYLKIMPVINALLGSVSYIVCIAIALIMFHKKPLVLQSILILGMAVFILAIAGGYRWYFQSRMRLDLEARVNLVNAAATMIISLTFLLWRRNVLWFCVGPVAGAIFALALSVHYCRKLQAFPSILQVQLQWREVWLTLRTGVPYALAALAITALVNYSTIMLGFMDGVHAVGIFGAAQRLMQAIRMLPAVILPVLLPILSRKRACGRAVQLLYYRYMFLAIGILALSVAILLTCLSPCLMSLIFGPKFDKSSTALAILGWGMCFAFMSGVNGAMLLAEHRIHDNLKIVIFALASEVLLGMILIPQYNVTGAAFTWMAAELIVMLGTVHALGQEFNHIKSFIVVPWSKSILAGFITYFSIRMLAPKTSTMNIVLAPAILCCLYFIFQVVNSKSIRKFKYLITKSSDSIMIQV